MNAQLLHIAFLIKKKNRGTVSWNVSAAASKSTYDAKRNKKSG